MAREAREVATGLSPFIASSGISATAHMAVTVKGGTHVGHVTPMVRLGKPTKPYLAPEGEIGKAETSLSKAKVSRDPSSNSPSQGYECAFSGSVRWSIREFINAHEDVVASGKHNYEECRIPIPTKIRYDRLCGALGNWAIDKESRVLELLKFGMPINCKTGYGVKKPQKNHLSAVSFSEAIEEYLGKNNSSQAILGPFDKSPIPGLCFSPLMTVPKEDTKRRVIVDFSFPPGLAINDGIPKVTYLDHFIEFNLPSVLSMTNRLNVLGKGCLMYK